MFLFAAWQTFIKICLCSAHKNKSPLWLLWASPFSYNALLSLSFLLHRKCFWWISRKARQKLCFYSRKLFTPNDAAFGDALIQTFHDIRWEVMSVNFIFPIPGPRWLSYFDNSEIWLNSVVANPSNLVLCQTQSTRPSPSRVNSAKSRQFRMSS